MAVFKKLKGIGSQISNSLSKLGLFTKKSTRHEPFYLDTPTWLRVFSYLPPKDLTNASLVCRFWHELVHSPILWRKLNIRQNHFSRGKTILKLLKEQVLLKQLHLSKLSDEYLCDVSAALKEASHLRHLSIGLCDVDSNNTLAPLAYKSHNLETLKVYNIETNVFLIRNIVRFHSIRTLSLDLPLDRDSVITLKDSALRIACFKCRILRDVDAFDVRQMFHKLGKNLKELVLCKVYQETSDALDAFVPYSQLVCLTLRDVMEMTKINCEVIKAIYSLQELRISTNVLCPTDPDDLNALFTDRKQMALETLHLTHTVLPEKIVDKIATACPLLSELQLNVGKENLESLMALVDWSQHLFKLILVNSTVGVFQLETKFALLEFLNWLLQVREDISLCTLQLRKFDTEDVMKAMRKLQERGPRLNLEIGY